MVKFQVHWSLQKHFRKFQSMHVSTSLQKTPFYQMSKVWIPHASGNVPVMIPATYARCRSCAPRSPRRDKLLSISEPSIPWHLKSTCKDFIISDNFLSILILTSNSCSISHTRQGLSEVGWICIHNPLYRNTTLDRHWHVPLGCFVTSQVRTNILPASVPISLVL